MNKRKEINYIILRSDNIYDMVNSITTELPSLGLYVYNVDNGSSVYSIIISKSELTVEEQQKMIRV